MNKQMKPDRSLLQFMLRAQQQLARQNAQSSDKGYVMMLTSIITILLFSMLGAYLTMTNLNKSAVAAYADTNNTFYAAESALNKRAALVQAKFDRYSTPSGIDLGKTAASISACFNLGIKSTPTADDFECLNFRSESSSNNNTVYQSLDGTSTNGSSWGGSGTFTTKTDTNNYLAYTFVADTTNYATAPIAPTATTPGTPGTPNAKVVPSGEDYAGLNVMEYKYTVYATAAKNNDPTQTVDNTDAKTVLQMDFKSRVIPLFQFAAFYNEDMEMSSSSNMDISGRIHTNGNLYVQPHNTDPNIATTFADSITAAGGIYNRIDSGNLISANGSLARLKLTSPAGTTYLNFPAYDSSTKSPIDLTLTPTHPTIGYLSAADSNIFKSLVKDKTSGIVPLTTPNAGFLRKRNYYKSSIASSPTENQAAVGEYWAKADIRLEMVPDRDVVNDGTNPLPTNATAATPTLPSVTTLWNRNEAIIPFNFTSIQAGAAGTSSTCTTTPPNTNEDPVNTYVDPTRNGASTLQCKVFTKGQLQSLRQPVLVLTDLNQAAGLREQEAGTLGATTLRPSLANYSTAVSNKEAILLALQTAQESGDWATSLLERGLQISNLPASRRKDSFKDELANIPGMLAGDLDSWSIDQIAALSDGLNSDNLVNRDKTVGKEPKILRALQVALASTSKPVPLDSLAAKFDNSTIYPAVGLTPEQTTAEAKFKETFKTLIGSIPGMSSGDLDSWTPRQIAALQGAWFLPAPIQRLTSTTSTTDVDAADLNYRSSGFYDGREQRWITMLQTNIKSLSVWNRDGLYVDATNEILAGADAAYIPKPASITDAFNSGNGANFTDGFAFIRAAADATQPTGSLRFLGLGSTNATAGGLVVHATVNDDLNGDDKVDVTKVNVDGSEIGTGTAAIPYDRDANGNIKYEKRPNGDYKTNGYEQNPDGTDKLDAGKKIPRKIPQTRDYLRKYWGQTEKKSPFGFAFNGGDFLPGALNIASDRAVYLQGNFNNNGGAQTAKGETTLTPPDQNRLPAAIMADTIAVLSNQCTSADKVNDPLGLPLGQINCGVPFGFYSVSGSTAVNAAFLSNTDRSVGNCAPTASITEPYSCNTTGANSGGLNNYMRMLEDWGGTNGHYVNYSGSFVSLGTPLEYSGQYLPGGTYYNIPARNFNFDTNLKMFSKLPPMTPSARYLQQEVFKRSFN
jgi:hypothetical protein